MTIFRVTIKRECFAKLSYMAALDNMTSKQYLEAMIDHQWSIREEKPKIRLSERIEGGTVQDANS